MVRLDFIVECSPTGVFFSLLAPLLFLIFISDLDEDIKSNILKFTDDTKIFKEVRSSQLQNDLDKLVLWAQKRQMEFNVNKCTVMCVGDRIDDSSYYIDRSVFINESLEKYLCVWISADMKCFQQCM